MKKTIGCAMIVIAAGWLALGGGAVGQSTAPATKPSTSPATSPTSQPAKELTLDLGNKVTMKLVLIPAGKFMMGSPKDEKGRLVQEGPQHEVTITKPFYMGIYEVTQEQWTTMMGTTPWKDWVFPKDGASNAANMISWGDATTFCKKLSALTGKTVCLPTEAQWEYACRAGSKTRLHYGEDDDYSKLHDYAWYEKNARDIREGYPHGVGQKKPNEFSLHDMTGNVWEWCSDWYADSYEKAGAVDPTGPASGKLHVVRGGSWTEENWRCRSAYRCGGEVNYLWTNGGFRVTVAP